MSQIRHQRHAPHHAAVNRPCTRLKCKLVPARSTQLYALPLFPHIPRRTFPVTPEEETDRSLAIIARAPSVLVVFGGERGTY